MQKNMTEGPITKTLILFALPMIAGNLLQQFYNIADTLVVGRFLGAEALAAVGSSYSLMTFLTAIILGLCMGSGAAFSICYGQSDMRRLHENMGAAFILIFIVTIILTAVSFICIDLIIKLLQVPTSVTLLMRSYLLIIFAGIPATFLYNYFAALLRSSGNSAVPLFFLAICTILNIILDLYFILVLKWGVSGAAAATIASQYISGFGLAFYTYIRYPDFRIRRADLHPEIKAVLRITRFSFLTALQQSIMNLGILMIQGLVNSFGISIMAAFAAAVKIDSFAYMPVQDFGNAFSIFIAQNYGAGKQERIREGIKKAVLTASIFSICISISVFLFAEQLMHIFISPEETLIISSGVQYLRIEGIFYIGIGILFLLYGLYRAVEKPGISVILTIISLGIRVVLAYTLAGVQSIGVQGIWWAVSIGWALADITGFCYYKKHKNTLFTLNGKKYKKNYV